MWLRFIRHRPLTRAVAALLALLICAGAFDWGHVGGDDPDFDIVVVQHDHNAHRLTTAPVSSPTENHCVICHSLQLLHHAVASRYQRVAIDLSGVHRLDGDLLAVEDGLAIGISSRGPPSIRL
jgi:hypothetical protein